MPSENLQMKPRSRRPRRPATAPTSDAPPFPNSNENSTPFVRSMPSSSSIGESFRLGRSRSTSSRIGKLPYRAPSPPSHVAEDKLRAIAPWPDPTEPKSRSRTRPHTSSGTHNLHTPSSPNATHQFHPLTYTRTNEPVVVMSSSPSYYSKFRRRISNMSLRIKRKNQIANADPSIFSHPSEASNGLSHKKRQSIQSTLQFDGPSMSQTSLLEVTHTDTPYASTPCLSQASSFVVVDVDHRERRLEKLSRIMGEAVPVELVFPLSMQDSNEKSKLHGLTAVDQWQASGHPKRRRGNTSFASISLSFRSLSWRKKDGVDPVGDDSVSVSPGFAGTPKSRYRPSDAEPESVDKQPTPSLRYFTRSPEPAMPFRPSTGSNTKTNPTHVIKRPSTMQHHTHSESVSSSGTNATNYKSLLYSSNASSGTSLSCVHPPQTISDLSSSAKPCQLRPRSPSVGHSTSSHHSITTIHRRPSPPTSLSAPSTPIGDRMISPEVDLSIQAEPERVVSRKRYLGQDCVEDLEQELHPTEILKQQAVPMSGSQMTTAPPDPILNGVDDEDSGSLSSFEACEDETFEDNDGNEDRTHHDSCEHVQPSPISSFSLDRAVSPHPPTRSPFLETLLLPAFMYPSLDQVHTSTEPIQAKVVEVGRRNDGEWSGQWNSDNIQDVIKKLRHLK